MLNRRIFRLLGCLGASLSIGLALASAQDNKQSSDSFFGKDFAKNPLDNRGASKSGTKPRNNSTQIGGAQSAVSPQELERVKEQAEELQRKQLEAIQNDPSMQEMLKKFGSNGADGGALVPQSNKVSPVDESSAIGRVRPVAVNALGAVISTVDKDHYEQSLLALQTLADSRRLPLSTIYTLGDFDIASKSPLIPGLIVRGAVLKVRNELPKGYDISLSPTYVVKTKEGEILLEAVGNVDKYFNQQGEFLDREENQKPKLSPPKLKPAALSTSPSVPSVSSN